VPLPGWGVTMKREFMACFERCGQRGRRTNYRRVVWDKMIPGISVNSYPGDHFRFGP